MATGRSFAPTGQEENQLPLNHIPHSPRSPRSPRVHYHPRYRHRHRIPVVDESLLLERIYDTSDSTLESDQVYTPWQACNSAGYPLPSSNCQHQFQCRHKQQLQLSQIAKDDLALADLIDFLRNHAPPPGSFMSIPYDFDERGPRWASWKKKAKDSSRSLTRRPRQIRLPDTAVSGTTIGGHRHIAITIPLEAFPLGDIPRSQYPITTPERPISAANIDLGSPAPSSAPKKSPIQRLVNEKGVITVLRTVDEEISIPQGVAVSHYRNRSLPQTPQRAQKPPAIRTSVLKGVGATTHQHHNSVVAFGDQRSFIRPRVPLSPGICPARASSSPTTVPNQHQQISIEENINTQDDRFCMALARPRRGHDGEEHEEWPLPRKHRDRPIPMIQVDGMLIDEEEDVADQKSVRNTQEKAVYKTRPRTASRGKPSDPMPEATPPQTPSSTKSRRERVRDKKRRDIEILRAKQSQSEETKVEGGLTFSPICVIVNVGPSSPTEESPPPLPGPKNPARGSPAESTIEFPLPPSFGPSKKPSFDRTSLSRRREWKATREQERRTKDSRATVRARARHLASGASDTEDDVIQTVDKEILRLYEAYREHRFRDMEKRVRRLEKNGDVWLRALVPVLDNLNSNIPSSSSIGKDVDGSWTSAKGGDYSIRLRHTQNAESLQHVHSKNTLETSAIVDGDAAGSDSVREDEKSRCGSSGSSGSDMSGLDTIEPLMRELAGAARLRQMKSGEIVHAY